MYNVVRRVKFLLLQFKKLKYVRSGLCYEDLNFYFKRHTKNLIIYLRRLNYINFILKFCFSNLIQYFALSYKFITSLTEESFVNDVMLK